MKEKEVQYFLSHISEYSADIIDKPSLQYLIDNITSDAPVKESKEYKTVLYQLKKIHEHYSKYCTYIYIIYPKSDKIYFVLAGHETFTEMDQYGALFDATTFDYMNKALNEQIPIVENHAGYDPDYKLYSISAYAPLFIDGKFSGLLGIDIELSNYNKLRYSYILIAIFIAFFGLCCIVITFFNIYNKLY